MAVYIININNINNVYLYKFILIEIEIINRNNKLVTAKLFRKLNLTFPVTLFIKWPVVTIFSCMHGQN